MVLGKSTERKLSLLQKRKWKKKSDIELMKTKNKGSGKVYKMVGRTTGLTEPCVVSIIYIYICNKIRYKYRFSFAFL